MPSQQETTELTRNAEQQEEKEDEELLRAKLNEVVKERDELKEALEMCKEWLKLYGRPIAHSCWILKKP